MGATTTAPIVTKLGQQALHITWREQVCVERKVHTEHKTHVELWSNLAALRRVSRATPGTSASMYIKRE